MLESLILKEFTEKDFNIFDQQILDLDLTDSDLRTTLDRILTSKSKSLQEKVALILREERRDLLNTAFKRAKKKFKTKMALRFMLFETFEVGE